MTKRDKIGRFDASSASDAGGGLFGLPFDTEDADVVVLPVPWEVTVSYGTGTAAAPDAIWKASRQVDLYDPKIEGAWKMGVAMDREPALIEGLARTSTELRAKAEICLGALTGTGAARDREEIARLRSEIDAGCRKMVELVRERALHHLGRDKVVGLVGGDHSTALGLLGALADGRAPFGILQIDAHADLRKAYEGFEHSHASIMFNVLESTPVERLVQVAVRDTCEEEVARARASGGRVRTFYDRDIKHRSYGGESFAAVCDEIVEALPRDVYLSFDIDGLDPALCPHTGTPVAGGFAAAEALFLLERVVDSGRRIVGFDLTEVAPGEGDEWDANVAARLLYRIANLVAWSNGRRPPS